MLKVTPQNFKRAIRDAYDELQEADSAGLVTLEVMLAPGVYEDELLKVGSDDDARPVKVVLRGSDPAQPSVLKGGDMRLTVHAVRLEHLVLQQTVSDGALLNIHVQTELELHACAFLANRLKSRHGGRLLKIGAGGTNASVSIRDCWFIKNRGDEETLLLGMDAEEGDFQTLTCTNSVFLANDLPVSVAPFATGQVNLHHCLVYAPGDQRFIAMNDTDTQLRMEDSILIGETLETLITRWSPDHPSPADYAPIHLQRTGFYVRNGSKTLPNADLQDTVVDDAPEMSSAALDTLIEQWSDRAAKGTKPQLETLRGELLP